MRRFHLTSGSALFVMFVLTGQYMRHVAHPHDLGETAHWLYRSRHIYVLMAALINLALGTYLRVSADTRSRRLQLFGSTVLALSGLALVVSFFYDAKHVDLQHLNFWWSRGGIYSLFLGVLLHVAAALTAIDEQPSRSSTDAFVAPVVRL